MPDRRQFDLQSRFHAGGVFIEDFQDQIHSISDIDPERAELFLDVENLSRFQNISNNQRVRSQSLHIENDFL